MKANGIRPVITRRHKATTDNRHFVGFIDNILDRDFMADATTADWIRTLLQDAVLSHHCSGTVSRKLRQLRGELGRLGNNLNQLAHAAHLGNAVACGDTLQDIDQLKDRIDPLLRDFRPARVQRGRSVSVPRMH